MDKKTKVGIWGAGNIAKTHAKALKEIGIEIVCVYDLIKENAEEVRRIGNGKLATDKIDDLFDSNPDVIHLCVPANLHYGFLKEIIERDINFICEKPLVLDSEEAKELLKLMEGKDILASTGFNVRYHDGIKNLKDELAKEDTGNINFIHGVYLQEYHVLPAMYGWRYDENTAGKMRAVTEIGSHIFDLIEYVCEKEIIGVSATFSYFNRYRKLDGDMMYKKDYEKGEEIEIKSEDASSITLKFNDGTIGNIFLCEATPGKKNFLDLEIICDGKTLKWNSEDINSIYLGKRNLGFTKIVDPFGGGFSDSHIRFFTDFYEDVEAGKENPDSNYPRFIDGVRNVLITNAIYESRNNDSKWVYINV